jgi:hypothetical protein
MKTTVSKIGHYLKNKKAAMIEIAVWTSLLVIVISRTS